MIANPLSKLTLLATILALAFVCYAQENPSHRNPEQLPDVPEIALSAEHNLIVPAPEIPVEAIAVEYPELAFQAEAASVPEYAPEYPVAFHPALPFADEPRINPQPEREV